MRAKSAFCPFVTTNKELSLADLNFSERNACTERTYRTRVPNARTERAQYPHCLKNLKNLRKHSFAKFLQMNSMLRSRDKSGQRSTYLTDRQSFLENKFQYDPSDGADEAAKAFFEEEKEAPTTTENRRIVVRQYKQWILSAHESPASTKHTPGIVAETPLSVIACPKGS